MPGGAASLALAAGAAAAAAAVGTALSLSPVVQGGRIAAPWHVVTLPQQVKPVTQYSAEAVDGRDAVRIQVQGSYGNLVHELPAVQAPTQLHWAWRMQQPNRAVDLQSKTGDDAAVKVCMSFDLPLDRVPFMERQVLKLARSRTGQDLPAATLCWVWGAGEAKGALLPNAYSRRVRYIVLRNREDALSMWFEEGRDVAADFRRAFGDETSELPPVTALIVAGDGDNTGGTSVAHVSGLRTDP